MSIYSEMTTKERAAIIRNRLRAVAGLKKIRVKMGRGTAGSWIDILGSDTFGKFTPPEKTALLALGMEPNLISSNGFALSPQETAYWSERLSNDNTGYEVHGQHYDGDGMYFTGWRGVASYIVESLIKQQLGRETRLPTGFLMEQAKRKPIRVGKIIVRFVDYKVGAEERQRAALDALETACEVAADDPASEVEKEVQEPAAPFQAVEITMTRWEGWYEREPSVTLTGEGVWEASDTMLHLWAKTAPRNGCYDKVKYRVLWENGDDYEGRFDLTYHDLKRSNLLATEMRNHVAFCVGQYQPPHMLDREYQAAVAGMKERLTPDQWQQYERFLTAYAFRDETYEEVAEE